MKPLSPEDKLEIIDRLSLVIRLLIEGKTNQVISQIGFAHDELCKMMKVPHDKV